AAVAFRGHSPGRERFDVIRRDAAVAQRRTDEVEDEARIVVVEIGVGVLEAADGVRGIHDRLRGRDGATRAEPWNPREAVADQPVEPGAQPEHERMPAEALLDGREEADLANRGGITADQVVAAHAEGANQRELAALHVLDAAPGE